jgi:hypothetical protein
VNFPNKVKYEEEFKIEFKINKMSDSNPTNIKINVKEYMKEMTIKELKDAQRISLNLKGKDLIEGNNTLKIIVEYKDLREKEYQEIEEINIELEKLNLIQKMISWMNKFNRKIGSMIQ